MDNFAAIDFETANGHPTSVCSVGVVVVRDGQIVDTFYSLIHPEPDYYLRMNSRVHGLTSVDTEDAPVFSEMSKYVFFSHNISATSKRCDRDKISLIVHTSSKNV